MVFLKKPMKIFITILVTSLPFLGLANSTDTLPVKHEITAVTEKTLTETEQKEEERKEFIKHHLLDSHDFHLFSYGKESGHEKHISFPLPVILWDNGGRFFEPIILYVRDDIAIPNIGEKHYKKYMSFYYYIFLYLVLNIIRFNSTWN
jgi:hypothetical protein